MADKRRRPPTPAEIVQWFRFADETARKLVLDLIAAETVDPAAKPMRTRTRKAKADKAEPAAE